MDRKGLVDANEDYQCLLADQGITCSMSRYDVCGKKAAMESFFSTLKIERVLRFRRKIRNEGTKS